MIIKRIFCVLFISFIGYLLSYGNGLLQKSTDNKDFYLYKVNSAEGFYSICKKFDVSKEEILYYNPSAKNGLKSGQELLIPIKGVKSIGINGLVHTVSVGETLFSIARMYHVSQDSIIILNPGSEKGIRVGTKLKIPQSNQGLSFDLKKQNSPNQYIYHTIAPKETLFSVAQKYGTSIDAILTQNSGLSSSNFTIGKVIKIIPKQNNNIGQEDIQTFPYLVKKKETLYSIARQFGITVDDIKACNGDVTLIKKNDVINIPQKGSEYNHRTMANNNIDGITDKFYSPYSSDKLSIAILLPFMLSQEESTKSSLYLEYYQGFLLAVDSLKKQGLSVDIHAYDTEGKNSTLKTILSDPFMKSVDLIIGPADNNLIHETATFALKNGINMVNVFSLKNDDVTHNSQVFQTNIPHSYLYTETVTELIRQFGNKQIIFLHDRGDQDEKKDFVDLLKSEANRQHILYKDFFIDKDPELGELNNSLPENSDILVISSSSSKNSVGKIIAPLTKLKDDRADLSITLFGYPEWQTYTKEYLNNFHKLNTVIFTRFYTNPTDYNWKEFQKKFYYWYNKDLINANPKYGLLGFDTGMYFLNALKKYGQEFENHLDQLNSSSIQTDFNFQKIDNQSGFINKGFYFVYFKPSYIIEKRVIK